MPYQNIFIIAQNSPSMSDIGTLLSGIGSILGGIGALAVAFLGGKTAFYWINESYTQEYR